MFPTNYMPIFYMPTRPQNLKFIETQGESRGRPPAPPQRGGRLRRPTPLWVSWFALCFCEFWVWGSSLHITNRHTISGKHAEELYADFYMPPKASDHKSSSLHHAFRDLDVLGIVEHRSHDSRIGLASCKWRLQSHDLGWMAVKRRWISQRAPVQNRPEECFFI